MASTPMPVKSRLFSRDVRKPFASPTVNGWPKTHHDGSKTDARGPPADGFKERMPSSMRDSSGGVAGPDNWQDDMTQGRCVTVSGRSVAQ